MEVDLIQRIVWTKQIHNEWTPQEELIFVQRKDLPLETQEGDIIEVGLEQYCILDFRMDLRMGVPIATLREEEYQIESRFEVDEVISRMVSGGWTLVRCSKLKQQLPV